MEMKSGLKVLCGAVTLASGVVATGVHAQTVVKIGSAAPLTGGMAHVGKDNENGARLAIEEINAQGLVIGGQKITLQLDAQDDGGDPRQATQVAQKLVDDKVVAVVGHLNSGTTIPASKIYSDAGIVQISPSATNPAYTQQGFRTTYRMVGTDAQQGPALAKYAAGPLKVKTLAVVDDSTAYGQGLADQFQKAAEALGIKVLSHDATNDKAIDFRAILTKIKGENPDAIMVGGMDPTGGPFARQARQLGLRARILGGDGMCTEKMPSLAGDAAGNVVCSEAGKALEKMPQGAAFAVKYEKRFGEPIQIYAPFSYDAVYIVVDAMKRANSCDPAKILAAMPGTNFGGVTGQTSFDAHGDLSHGVITLYTYKNGKKTILDMVTL
ncbi:branched-chain amino acid ABC transporter substrate-binding protein [Burkholderia sp. IDO3]|uniref:branched-chain amino acid ABC transporter substrate-binding protein n=1 Tax=Burkholderia sp. IDO3 TaxID=1705310 RepID=UPI000BBAD4E8|nr:branched-chain amino acid ABC transporter substrate-binding protein [Burkholderia sp. IDO3]AXK65157.1 branched-chain amino acid ABC transporter substrate-binding protein [Burkholderia sp. IDO3]PCD61745.1 branched chain amino acid ABC transporter substrate-binding protein [Burkholderia sp. IDO3]